MKSSQDLLQNILTNGKVREDRTGVGTVGIFGYQWRHNMINGFPLLTTKKVHFKSILIELLWFLRGDTNIKYLRENGVTIWDEWADAFGDLGPVYGKQWRAWTGIDKSKTIVKTVDQIKDLLVDLKANPNSRRHVVSAWNPIDVPSMKLPPCHTLWQCYVSEGKLSIHLYARSIDAFLGLPFNIASYALLILILGQLTDLKSGELIISFGDLHIYRNHMQQVREQLSREPKQPPIVAVDKSLKIIDDLRPDKIQLIGYEHHPAIKAPIAV